MAGLEQLMTAVGERPMLVFALTLARIAPLFILAPLFSNKQFPVRARGVCAVALAIGLGPIAAKGADIPADPWILGGIVGKELLVGAAFSFAVGAVIAAVAIAGSYMDTLIGFSFGGLIDPVTGNQSTIIAQFYALIATLVFIAIGGDAWLLKGLARTYELVPLTAAPALGPLVEGVQHAFVGIAAGALEVCAPIMLALVITDAAFGVISRVMPQLNVFAVGFPAKVVVGFLLIGVTLPFVSGWMSDELQRSVSTALRSIHVG